MSRRLNAREHHARRMGRLSRRHVCKRKHRFSQDRAIRLARKRSEETGTSITAYPCGFCEGWHIGHTPGSRRPAA